jgi:hypothetical protein
MEHINYQAIFLVMIGASLVIGGGLLLRAFFLWRSLQGRSMVFLMIIPPASGPRAASTQQLFNVIHGQRVHSNLKDRVLRKPVVMSFEVVSTRSNGIRYIVQIEQRQMRSVHRALTTHIPGARIEIVSSGYITPISKATIYEFKQKGHQLLPLRAMGIDEDTHGLHYIANAMTGLEDQELMSYQLVISPLRVRVMQRIVRRLPDMEDIRAYAAQSVPYMQQAAKYTNRLLFSLTDMVGEMYHGPHRNTQYTAHHSSKKQMNTIQLKYPDRFGRKFMEASQDKASQALFEVRIRVCIQGDSVARTADLLQAMTTAFDAYMAPPYQGLQKKLHFPGINRYRYYLFRHRLPGLRGGNIFSATELANLYHFPDR